MVVVSSREFRANQRKYFDLALTDDVVITSRSHGSYRLVPLRESDMLIDQTTLEAKIRRGIEEYEQGKVHRMEEGESVDAFLSRMINEECNVQNCFFQRRKEGPKRTEQESPSGCKKTVNTSERNPGTPQDRYRSG